MSRIERLHNRINLIDIPYTDRGSRLLMFLRGDRLSFRLAERWVKWENEVGHYRKRPPMIEQFAFLDADGTPLSVAVDSYPHRIRLHTAAGDFDWTFVDAEALVMRLPSGQYGFEFDAYAQRAQADRRGGTMHGKRNIAYTTSARIISNEIVPLADERFRVRLMVKAEDGNALLLNVTPRLGFNRSIPNPDEAIAESRTRWQAWFDAAPPVLDAYMDQYLYAWWIMRAGLLNTRYYFTREALVPSKIHYVGVWQWDQFFHALAYRHLDTKLAEDQLRIVIDHQREDGMFPDAIHDEGLVTHLNLPVEADVTKPPLIAWAALKLYEKSGHLDFIEEVYEAINRWHGWWLRENMNANGLCEYRHPFSSGLDDSPLWDEGMPVVAPDLNTYLCIQSESLARMAELIGQQDDAARFRQDVDRWVERMIAVLWNEGHGYFDALLNGRRLNVFTPFALMPLWTGRLPAAMNERLVRHLTDPATFWGPWPLPTVAMTDPKFDPDQMWRGPVWPNINLLFVEGLERIGQVNLARDLRRKTLDLIMQHKDIYEYYNPLTGAHPPKAAPIFGWTSAVFIDLALQETANAEEVRPVSRQQP